MQISVIIPTHNRPELTIRAIKSVIEQTYKKWELLIIDDGSTDNTFSRAHNYLSDFKHIDYKLISKSNVGVSHSRNLGAHLAKYDWLSFLDSDDEWLPNKLQKQVNYIQKNPSYKWVYCNENWIKNGNPINKPASCEKYQDQAFQKAVWRCFIGCSTVLMQKKLYKKHNGFNEDFVVCEDYDLWIKLLIENNIGYIDEALINKYAGHDNQLSFRHHSMNYWRVLSLNNLINNFNLPLNYKLEAQKFITEKSPQLINGFTKYKNQEKLKTVSKIHSSTTELTL